MSRMKVYLRGCDACSGNAIRLFGGDFVMGPEAQVEVVSTFGMPTLGTRFWFLSEEVYVKKDPRYSFRTVRVRS